MTYWYMQLQSTRTVDSGVAKAYGRALVVAVTSSPHNGTGRESKLIVTYYPRRVYYLRLSGSTPLASQHTGKMLTPSPHAHEPNLLPATRSEYLNRAQTSMFV